MVNKNFNKTVRICLKYYALFSYVIVIVFLITPKELRTKQRFIVPARIGNRGSSLSLSRTPFPPPWQVL